MQHDKYFALLYLDDDCYLGRYDKFALEKKFNANPNIFYWCFAEHVTPSGQNVLLVFLHYFSCVPSAVFEDLDNSLFKVVFLKKPSNFYRRHIKEIGFDWNLGKSKPVPGTFVEKKGVVL